MERTLILCKPDCMQKNLAGEVIGRIQKAGLRIQAAKVLRLTDALLAEHYSHLTDKPFFPEIVQFMKSAPVLGLIMTGDNAVATVRDLLGPTDSRKADKGTIDSVCVYVRRDRERVSSQSPLTSSSPSGSESQREGASERESEHSAQRRA